MEHNGIPIDVEYLHELEANWQALRLFYIRRDDEFGLYEEDGSFCTDGMEVLVQAKGWATWPRTITGKLELKSTTIGKQAKHHPELRKLQKLRDTIAELRLGAFLNTIGEDGCSRIAIMPLWTRTGAQSTLGAGQGVFAVDAVLDPWIDPTAAGLGRRRARLGVAGAGNCGRTVAGSGTDRRLPER